MRGSPINKIFVTIFIGLISTPLIVMFFSEIKAESTSEKRTLKTWTTWEQSESIVHYFTGITEYVQDHFGFRDQLISLNTKVLLTLNQSPADKVIKGRNDWLFYKAYDALSRPSLDRSKIISAIERRARHVSYRANVLAELGIAYTYVVAPNKMVMYLENMPRVYALSENNRMYDLFSSYLVQSNKKFHFDLQGYLLEQKTANKKQDIGFDFYYKNDTHWNHYGAYIAYQGISSFIKEQYPTLNISPSRYSFSPKEKKGGDLARFIGLNDGLVAVEPSVDFPICSDFANIVRFEKGQFKGECNTNGTKAIFIGDSFRTNLYPFIAQSVGVIYMVRQGINHKELDKLIKKVQPDIVIEEIVQRNLAKALPY